MELARDFSPRVEAVDERSVALDVEGLEPLWGDLQAVGAALRQAAIERGLRCRVAIAATRIAALLTAQGRDEPLTVVESGREADALAPLPLAVLEQVMGSGSTGPSPSGDSADGGWSTIPVRTRFGRSSADRRFREARRSAGRVLQILRRWGLSTLGDLAALPRDALVARLGSEGERWQRCARGDERRPLVPALEDPPFEESLELDWPTEGLEPLSFVLGRVLDPLGVRLAHADAAAAVLCVRLWLVTRVWHVRTLQLPAPIRDPCVLRTLLLLDLESHPPPAGVDRVTVTVTPAPARVVQLSLLERAGPSAEQLTTLLARLTALMGERRCGAPALVDSHRPGMFDIRSFDPKFDRGFAPNPRAGVRGDPESPAPHPREPRRARLVPHAEASLPHAAGLANAPMEGHTAHRVVVRPRRGAAPAAAATSVVEARPLVGVGPHEQWMVLPREGPSGGLGRKAPHANEAALAVLRRFRIPLAARVVVDDGRPVRVSAGSGVGSRAVETCAGPWRTSGHWWEKGRRQEVVGRRSRGYWSHDEWDVALRGDGVYRIYRDRVRGGWFVAGMVD